MEVKNKLSLSYDMLAFEQLVAYAKSRCALISQYEGLSHGHAGLKPGVGENLYWGANSAPTLYSGNAAVKAWSVKF